MRVLLTGASGFIGQYVLTVLTRAGIETVTVGRHAPGEGAYFVEADLLGISDFQPLMAEIRASHLLHLAWCTEHGKYWASPLNLRWVETTTRLVESFCKAGGKRIVVSGTCAEYEWAHGYCREDSTPLVPATLYGTAKDAVRRLVSTVCTQYQATYAWGRVFLPYGSGEVAARLIPSLIDVFQGEREPFGVNAGAYRDFLHVSDVAEAFFALLRSDANGAYNISSGQPMLLAELVRQLARLLGKDPEVILRMTSERPCEPPFLIGENLKLKDLGWHQAITLTEGLKEVVAKVSA